MSLYQMAYSAAHILIHNKQIQFIRIGIHKSEKNAYLALESMIKLKKGVSYIVGEPNLEFPNIFY